VKTSGATAINTSALTIEINLKSVSVSRLSKSIDRIFGNDEKFNFSGQLQEI
jgi:hypothetical protein